MNKDSSKNNTENNNLIEDVFPIIHSELLSKIEEAENGCIFSMQELYFAFRDGEGAKQDYERAEQYLQAALEYCENNPDKNLMKADILAHRVYLDMKFMQINNMRYHFDKLLKFQMENLVLEDWNWDAIKIMAEICEKSDIIKKPIH